MRSPRPRPAERAVVCACAVWLAACGGGDGEPFVPTARVVVAAGDARIATSAAQGGETSAFSLSQRLAAAVTAAGGRWNDTDLVVVEGGRNDLADLVTASLGAASDDAVLLAYRVFLQQQLDPSMVAAALAQPDGTAVAARMYLQALADTFFDAIRADTLDKGATHVAVLALPDPALAPQLSAALAGVAQAEGAAAAAMLEAAIRDWVGDFNTRLQARIGEDLRVALVDSTGEAGNAAEGR